MRLDVFTPSGTETNDVKRSGTVGPSRGPRPNIATDAPGGAWQKERPQVSSMGLLMRELHGIKSEDPQAFAQITASISQQLQTLAGEDPEGVERLLAMAERFDRASVQGDLSPFKPDPQPYGHVLRGPWAYRQSNELQEARADVQAVINQVLHEYANGGSVPSGTATGRGAADTQGQQPRAAGENVGLAPTE